MNFFSRRDFTLSLVIESDLQLNRANDSDIHCSQFRNNRNIQHLEYNVAR